VFEVLLNLEADKTISYSLLHKWDIIMTVF